MKGNQEIKWTFVGLIVLCLILVGFAFFFGGWVPALAALLLLLLVIGLALWSNSRAQRSHRVRTQLVIAIILGLVGGVLAFWSALSALLAVGSDPLYHGRLWAGWLALLLPVLASLTLLWLRTRPVLAASLLLLSGLGGFVCINLFFINTFYALSIPFWVLAVAIRLAWTEERE